MEGLEKWRKLKVWKNAHEMVLEIYSLTEFFPKNEIYGLVSQMRRAAVSVVANIVEGTKRTTVKDRIHFYTMSDTSLEELKYYFILAYQLQYISEERAKNLTYKAREVGRMLNGLKNVQK